MPETKVDCLHHAMQTAKSAKWSNQSYGLSILRCSDSTLQLWAGVVAARLRHTCMHDHALPSQSASILLGGAGWHLRGMVCYDNDISRINLECVIERENTSGTWHLKWHLSSLGLESHLTSHLSSDQTQVLTQVPVGDHSALHGHFISHIDIPLHSRSQSHYLRRMQVMPLSSAARR